ncbi:MAG: CoB--CoM heterodisulfide reductase iron-sulfur subunit A family protein [Desulfobacteraceae bacterium]|nr:CoB--CoM heterodisulfide reductase iron-sulfur subunit A family protein [Desulfobacteraceae bacterium]
MKANRPSDHHAVLIIGGGIGGIKAALDLSEARKDVILIDKSPAIGGVLTQLDRTFPTNNCDICTLSPNLSAGARQKHIDLMPLTQLTGVEGEAGNFTITLTTAPRYIDTEKCTACGLCLDKFPKYIRFTPGLDHRAPTCMRYPRVTPHAFSVKRDQCSDFETLASVCPAGAIIQGDKAKTRQLHVGAIIVAVGADVFSPEALDNYGYGKLPNVVTSLEYERIMSASGPTFGELQRPSDGCQPRRVAWIQCAGSRGQNKGEVSYCSSVCCMFALKEAIVTKERFKEDIETTIFYMDMRTFGKDYEMYYQRAKEDYHVRLKRCRPHSIIPADPDGALKISYVEDGFGTLEDETYDMVVLATGFRPSAESTGLAKVLGIELNDHCYARTGSFNPVATSRPGIYACGVFEAPKDIPETLVQASASACLAGKHLLPAATADSTEPVYPPEKDITGELPRIGVFVCDCGQNISGTVDVPDVVNYAGLLPHVVVSRSVGYGCSRESLDIIRKTIADKKLNRVVIGGCSPRTHESLFQDTLMQAGLNKYMLEIANIRDQNAWVHADRPEDATRKAKELIRMASAGVVESHPLIDHILELNQSALVIGGGVSGMNAALELAEQNYTVYLAEQAGELGGLARQIHRTIDGSDVPTYLSGLMGEVRAHKNIEVILNAVLVDHEGLPGMFKTGFQIAPQMYYRQIEHGVTILAVGAAPNRVDDYLLDKHEAVCTQMELGNLIHTAPDKVSDWENVVMIQCVGSRTPDNPNCSRICCQAAIKNALWLLDSNPDLNIYILYRDMRTYGFLEDYYLEARRRGVIFVRYTPESPPVVEAGGAGVHVTFNEPMLGMKLMVVADCLALSTGFKSDDESTEDLAKIFHLTRTGDGYFLEDHTKLKPVDMSVPGFFVAGTAHSPKNIGESITQAHAAAGRAITVLSRNLINMGASVAQVDKERCATCLVCVRACPYDVPFINEDRYSEIDPSKCHGCGTCASECPAQAIQLTRFEDRPMMAKLEGLLERKL